MRIMNLCSNVSSGKKKQKLSYNGIINIYTDEAMNKNVIQTKTLPFLFVSEHMQTKCTYYATSLCLSYLHLRLGLWP